MDYYHCNYIHNYYNRYTIFLLSIYKTVNSTAILAFNE